MARASLRRSPEELEKLKSSAIELMGSRATQTQLLARGLSPTAEVEVETSAVEVPPAPAPALKSAAGALHPLSLEVAASTAAEP